METIKLHWQLFGYAYMSCLFLAIMGAYLGVYVVLRRIVFLGMGIIQMAAVGVALAYLINFSPFVLSLIATFLGIIFFAWVDSSRNTSRESIIGVIYCCAGAITILLINKSALGSEEIKHYLYGQILLVSLSQLWTMIIVFLIVAAVFVLFHKEILFSSFDAETAKAMGINVQLWNLCFYFSLGVVIAISTKVAGVLVMFSYLVIPAVTALLICEQMKSTFIVAIVSAILSTVVGLFLQHLWGFPPGQTIVVTCTWLLVTVWLAKKNSILAGILVIATIATIGYIEIIPPNQSSITNKNEKSVSANQHKEHTKEHKHPYDIEIIIQPRQKVYKQKDIIILDIVVKNHLKKHYLFYLHLDLGGIDSISKQYSITSDFRDHIEIAPEKLEFLQGEQIILPTFTEDKDGFIALSKIKGAPIIIVIE